MTVTLELDFLGCPVLLEPPDLTIIESTVVRSVIRTAWSFGQSSFTRVQYTVFENTLYAAREAGVLGEVLREAVRYKVLWIIMMKVTRASDLGDLRIETEQWKHELVIDILKEVSQIEDNALRCTVTEVFLMQAERSRVLPFVVNNCLKYNISTVKAALKCGLLSDVLREVMRSDEIMTWPVKGCVIIEVQEKAKESGFSLEDVEGYNRWDASLVQVAIKCGLLTNLLAEALMTGNMAMLLDGARKSNQQDEVLIEAKKLGLLPCVIKNCIRSNISLVSGAIKCGLLPDVLREAEECGEVMTGPVKGGVIEEVQTKAKESGVSLDVVEDCHRWDGSLLQVANECGLLTSVLGEAVFCGHMTTLLDGAMKNGFFEQLLMMTDKAKLLLYVALSCQANNVSLVEAANKCGLLTNVLKSAALRPRGIMQIGLMQSVLDDAIKAGLLEKVLTEAKKSGLLETIIIGCGSFLINEIILRCKDFNEQLVIDLIQRCKRNKGESPLPCTESTDNEGLSYPFPALVCSNRGRESDLCDNGYWHHYICYDDVKEKEEDSDLYVDIIKRLVSIQGIGPVVSVAKKRGILGVVVRAAWKLKNLRGIVQGAEQNDELVHVLIEAEKIDSKCVDDVLFESDIHAKLKFGMVSFSNASCRLLSYAYLTGRLRKTLTVLSHADIKREEILEAAEDQEIIEEVLEAEHLNKVFEEWDAIIACLLLLCIIRSGKPRRTSHCSSEHRKCIVDHVTLCSGDIERNPGPVFINDWLKEMFALLVRVVYGCKAKRIPWKKFGRLDPSNSGLNRKELRRLFDRTLMQDSETRIPATHSEEFQMLQAYIANELEPDLGRLDMLIKTRKLMTSLKKNLEDFKSMPSEIQLLINGHLRRENLGFHMKNTNTEALEGDEADDDEEAPTMEREERHERREPVMGNETNNENGEPTMEREEIRECEGTNVTQRDGVPTMEGPETNEGTPTMQQHEDVPVEDKPRQDSQILDLPLTAPAVLNGRETTLADDIEDMHQIYGNEAINHASPFWSGSDMTDIDYLLDTLESYGVDIGNLDQLNESEALESVSVSEDKEILQDPMERILDQAESIVNKKEDGNVSNIRIDSNDYEEPSDPCRDGVTDSSTLQEQQSDLNMELALLKKRYETLLLNFERFTGLKNSDTREYNLDDNELTELRTMSRKRRASSSLSGEEVSKCSRFQ